MRRLYGLRKTPPLTTWLPRPSVRLTMSCSWVATSVGNGTVVVVSGTDGAEANDDTIVVAHELRVSVPRANPTDAIAARRGNRNDMGGQAATRMRAASLP